MNKQTESKIKKEVEMLKVIQREFNITDMVNSNYLNQLVPPKEKLTANSINTIKDYIQNHRPNYTIEVIPLNEPFKPHCKQL